MSCAPADEWGAVMRSAFECFQHAAKSEQLASATIDEALRALLLSTASNWRAMGKAAKAREQREVQLAAKHLSAPPAEHA